MPRIDVPTGTDPLMHLWTGLAPDFTGPAAALSAAVYGKSTLSLREFEAARVRIAQLNDCLICLNWRSERDVPARAGDPDAPDEDFYAHVGADLSWDGFRPRERLAARFADLFVTDHTAMDDDFWAQMHAHFTDDEIVELGICVGGWLASGRLQRVLDVDGACRVPLPAG
jgi:alkylhydroperoxidase family enzyme